MAFGVRMNSNIALNIHIYIYCEQQSIPIKNLKAEIKNTIHQVLIKFHTVYTKAGVQLMLYLTNLQ